MVDAMTVWEFEAVMDGLRQFHGGKPARGTGMTEGELRELGIEGFDDGDD